MKNPVPAVLTAFFWRVPPIATAIAAPVIATIVLPGSGAPEITPSTAS